VCSTHMLTPSQTSLIELMSLMACPRNHVACRRCISAHLEDEVYHAVLACACQSLGL
jgi:hypothetical protein